jgi:hypothetical protein
MGFDVSGRFCAKMVKYTANVKKMFVAKTMRSPAVGGNTIDRELRIPQ